MLVFLSIMFIRLYHFIKDSFMTRGKELNTLTLNVILSLDKKKVTLDSWTVC